MPSRSSWSSDRLLSRSRSTAFSPQIVAMVATRTSSGAAVDRRLELAVLRTPPLDDVHVGHDLDAAHQRLRHRWPGGARHRGARRRRGTGRARESSCGSMWTSERAVAHRLGEDALDDLDDRRVLVDHQGRRRPRRRWRRRPCPAGRWRRRDRARSTRRTSGRSRVRRRSPVRARSERSSRRAAQLLDRGVGHRPGDRDHEDVVGEVDRQGTVGAHQRFGDEDDRVRFRASPGGDRPGPTRAVPRAR